MSSGGPAERAAGRDDRGNGHENVERGWLGDGTVLCLPIQKSLYK
jgi:hypothetical protein